MITNITVFGLNNNYVKVLGKLLADAFDMFFADVMELLSFDLIDLVEAKNVVGKDYILKQERNKIKTLSTYENTVVSCDYRSLNNEDNYKNLIKSSILVYIKVEDDCLKQLNKTYKQSDNLDLFNDVRTELLEKKANIVCDVSNLKKENAVSKIVKEIYEYYLKQ